MKKTLLAALKIGLSGVIVGYLVWKAYHNESFLELQREQKNWFLLLGALVACTSAVLLTLIRWCYLVRALGMPFKFKDAFRLGFLGYLFNLAPMGIVGGDLLKAVMLSRHQGGRRAEALATVFADRVIGLYLLFVVASIAILLTGFGKQASEEVQWVCRVTLCVTAIAAVGVIVALLPDFSGGKTTRWMGRIPYVGRPLLRLVEAIQMYRRRLPVLAAAAVMTVAVHSLFTLGIFLIASGLYDQVHSLGQHFVLGPLSAATQIIPIPAGHVEASLDWLYAQTALPNGQMVKANAGLMVALCYRMITLLIAAIGICYYLASREELAEVLHEAEDGEGEDEIEGCQLEAAN